MRLTVGPLPPAVYWRRRALVLGAILLVLFLVTQACIAASADGERQSASSPSSPDASSSPPAAGTPTVDASADASTQEPDGESGGDGDSTSSANVSAAGQDSPPVGEVARCADEDMVVTAVAEQRSFAQGSSVRFDIEVSNGSDERCRRDVGSGQRELFLRRESGADREWSSRDCVELVEEDEQVLPADFNTGAWVDWNGRASSECDGPQPAGDLLEGEFELVARLGTVYSDPVEITIE